VPLPRRPVVVSFDDGYLSHYTQAARILRKLRWPGVENLELGDLRHKGGLTPTMVKTMIRHGWEVASHTLTHPDLTAIGPAKLRHELVGSRAELRRRFGVPADFFCYPAGRWNPRVADAVRRAGYRGATTEVPGLAQPGAPYSLARINVSQTTTAAGLLAQLR
jgi:peptidoglycan/xylan/chitin deacetylase (PgdA/CDA1 family)